MVRALTSHQCGPGLIPGLGVICGLSLLLVLILAVRVFSPGTPAFHSSQKPTFPNFNSIWRVSLYCKAHLIISSWNYALYKFTIFIYNGQKTPRNGQIIAVKIVKPPYARPTLPNRLAGLHGRPVLANGKPPKSSGNAACYR